MIGLSSYVETLGGKPVAVFGLGSSGVSVSKALVEAGAKVVAWDDKEESRNQIADLDIELQDLCETNLQDFSFLVLAPGIPYTFEPHPVVVNAQKHDVEIIGDLELLHRCGHGLKTIGITGTNGKSTTTALMTYVLNQCGVKSKMGGNIGKAVFDLEVNSDDVLVLEISSYQMDLCPMFRPDISVLLNITPDHLDRHGGMLPYVEAKGKIMEGEGTGIICVDDDFTQEIFNKTFFSGDRKVFPVSMRSKIDEGHYLLGSDLYENHAGEEKLVGHFEGFHNLKGRHNLQNAVCTYVVAKNMGLEIQNILKAFGSFPGLPHRQYVLRKEGNVSYINDSKATNGEAAAKALASYDNIYWIVGGQSKEGGLQGLEIFRDRVKKAYVIGEASEEFSFWLSKNRFLHEVCSTLDVATRQAHADALQSKSESIILLSPACASWDQFSSFEERGNYFAEQVEQLIGKT